MDQIEGIIKIANVFLSIMAGYIALTMFKISHERKDLRPWKLLIIALIFFAAQEILGALRAFKIFENPYLTHIIPTAMLALLLSALLLQADLARKK